MKFSILFIFIALIANYIFADGKPAAALVGVSFDKSFYEATYTDIEGKIDTITIAGAIKISAKEAIVTLSGDYAYHFAVDCSTGNCLLTVTDDLSEDTLTKQKEIILGLEASTDGTTERGIALVMVHLPLDNVKQAPKFTQPYYIYKYQIGDKNLTADGNPIDVTSDTKASVTIAVSDYQDTFAVTYEATVGYWNIEITKNLPANILNDNTQLIIGLTDVLGNSDQGTAALLIELPVKAATHVTFGKTFYEATYTSIQDKIDLIAVDGNIQISVVTAKVTLSGDYAHHFAVECENGGCKLTLTEDLPEDTLTNNKEIIIGLEGTVEETNERSVALLIVHLPLDLVKQAPKFSQPYYFYKYQLDDNGKPLLTPNGNPVDVTTKDKTSVTIGFSDYQDTFAATYNAATDQWNIAMSKKLPVNILNENTELIVGLTDALGNSDQDTATLIIELPVKAAVNVTFDKSFYEASYTAIPDQIDLVAVGGSIILTDKDARVTITGDYTCHFGVDCSSGTCLLTVTDDLPEDTLTNNKEIIVGLEASTGEPTERGIALVIVHLPLDKPAPKFSQTYYIYKYQSNGEESSLSANGDPLAIASDNNTAVKVTLSKYRDNFVVTYDSEADQWNIVVNEPLDESVLNANTELVLSLTGELDNSEKGTATLLIILPDQDSLDVAFDKSFYRAKYSAIPGQPDVITIAEEIAISDSDATVTITGDFAFHFNVDCSSGYCQLTVKEDFAEDILASTYETVIQIEASKDHIAHSVITIVIVSLPLQNTKPAPKFSQTYYIYDYQIDDEGTPSLTATGDSISVINDDDGSANVILSDYQDNFAFTYDPDFKQFTIAVQEPLDDSILKTNSELFISISGTVEGTDEVGTATLVIKLPVENDETH